MGSSFLVAILDLAGSFFGAFPVSVQAGKHYKYQLFGRLSVQVVKVAIQKA